MSASKTIELETGIDINGARVKSMTMREPTVADQIAAQEIKSSRATQEVAMLANLCEVAPEDLHRLTLRDYGRLQEALRGFTE